MNIKKTGELIIRSRSEKPFQNRKEAGQLLAEELLDYSGKNTVVLGIPRGGIILASEIANRLQAKLDIVLTHKLGAPGNQEYAIGAITEDGRVIADEMILSRLGISADYIEREKQKRLAEIQARAEKYRRVLPKCPLKGQTVIVTDDGLATGATMQAALMAVSDEKPAKLICAVPVAPEDNLGKVVRECDQLICLRVPDFFSAVGQFYLNFGQVSDEEVLDILENAKKVSL